VGEPVTTLVAASSNSVAPGTLGFLVVFGMAVVLFFLFRSMSKHLRKVNAAARRDQEADSPGAEDGRGDAASTSSSPASSGDRRRKS
jgi:hypothetical protein